MIDELLKLNCQNSWTVSKKPKFSSFVWSLLIPTLLSYYVHRFNPCGKCNLFVSPYIELVNRISQNIELAARNYLFVLQYVIIRESPKFPIIIHLP